MRHSRLAFLVCLLAALALPSWAQKGEGYGNLMTPQVRSGKLGAPEHLRSYIVDGKLRLSLRDAVEMTLENNSMVRVQEGDIESSKFTLLGAHAPFDPIIGSVDNITGTISPPFAFLGSIGGNTFNFNFKNTTKNLQFNYTQTFETGTQVQTGLSTNIDATNVSLGFFNPFTTSSLNFQFTQPLLRNGWFAANRGPLVIARRNLDISRATFAAEVNNNVLQAVNQYWAVVEAQGNLEVARTSMTEAEATYKHNKRELELGALPSLGHLPVGVAGSISTRAVNPE